MRPVLRICGSCLFLLFSCSTSSDPDLGNQSVDLLRSEVAGPAEGEFTVLTYNVAGLPEGMSKHNPEKYFPMLAPLLNGYDLVLVQEDFWYHDILAAASVHPYKSEPMLAEPDYLNMGDGLNRLSNLAFDELTRIQWVKCSGGLDCSGDCLTTKGFSVARTLLPGDLQVDVYNLHADAGSCDEDFEAREAGVKQMVEEIKSRSKDVALIVAADTNMKTHRPLDKEMLDYLYNETGLINSCLALDCPDDGIDRILFRSSAEVELTPLEWQRRISSSMTKATRCPTISR